MARKSFCTRKNFHLLKFAVLGKRLIWGPILPKLTTFNALATFIVAKNALEGKLQDQSETRDI